MNIYIQELKMLLKSSVYWTAGMLLTLIFFLMLFPVIAKDAAVMQQILDKFPPEFTKALGLSTLDLSVVNGFYGFLFTYILLIGSVFAMKSGISALSEEIRVKTVDFLVAKPVSRTAIVSAKLAGILTCLFLQNIIYIPAAFITANLISDKPFNKNMFLLINLSLPLVQLFFAAFGLFLSAVIKRIKTVLPVTLGVVFGFFVLQLLNQSLVDAKLAYITPFAYFDIPGIIKTASYDVVFLVIDCIMIVTFTALAYVIYNKKDMPSL